MLKLSLTLLAACCLLASTAAAQDDLAAFKRSGQPLSDGLLVEVRRELLQRIEAIWVNLPANTVCSSCLIGHWSLNTGSSVARKFPVSQIDLALFGLPTELIDKVKAIAYANKVIFELIRFSINAPIASGHYLQYLGIARRSGDEVEFALVRGEVIGAMVQKYMTIHYRTCGKFMWWECCCQDHYQTVPRGYDAAEILRIETAMRAETVARLRDSALTIALK